MAIYNEHLITYTKDGRKLYPVITTDPLLAEDPSRLSEPHKHVPEGCEPQIIYVDICHRTDKNVCSSQD